MVKNSAAYAQSFIPDYLLYQNLFGITEIIST